MKTLLRSPYPTLLWTLVVLVLTLTPSDKMPETPAWRLLSFDTAAHAGVFALLAALAYPWLRARMRRPGWLVLLGSVGLGAAIEGLQYAMHLGRHAEWTDLLSDTIGTVLVLATIGLGRRGRRSLAATSAVALAALAAHAQDTPDLTRVRRTIAELASPKMHGRGYVKQGEHIAAAYLRGRLRQLGLQPLAPDYTQPFTLDVNTFPGKLIFTTRPQAEDGPPEIHQLRPGVDFIAAPESGGTNGPLTVTLNRLDTLAFSNAAAQRRLQARLRQVYYNSLLSDRHALLLTAKEEQRLKELPTDVQQTLDSAAVHIVVVPKLTASLAPAQQRTPRLEVLRNQSIWRPFGWSGLPDENAAPQAQLQLDAQLIHDYPTQNLAAVVRGSVQPDSFVVVTAHYDHLGMMGKNTYFPGANDNASGVALLLELAAHYARPENRPRCSVAFLLFGAEEAGLLGSTYFVQHPLLPLARIRFLVNLDLLGTGEEGATVVNGKVHEAAYRQLTALNDAHHYLPRLTARGRAANSDHYPFSEAGVPAFFLYTRGGSLAYHDVQDQPGALSLTGFAGAYALVRDFLNLQGAAPAGRLAPGP